MATKNNILSITNLMLVSALGLSATAAWYSIMGLIAIFPGAVVPIIIVGSILEFAKIVTTVWLHKYWIKTPVLLKLYLVPAVLILALITSMGVFGFLSKAHIEQGIPTTELSTKISFIDEKIKIEEENIQAAKNMLAQMDAQVNARLDRGNSESSAERSVIIRRQQAPERNKLLRDIQVAQQNIAKLNEEKLPITVQYKKIESEVGPIKYVAALIYGDTTDQNLLENAVRWVIILIVIVFDPLALMSVIASNSSRRWDKSVTIVEEKTIEHKNTTDVIPEKTEEKIIETKTIDEQKIDNKVEETVVPINDIQTTDTNISIDSNNNNNNVPVKEKVVSQVEDNKLPYELLPDNYVVYNGKLMKLKALKELHPELFVLKKNR
jgi:hypothetical protein